MAPFVGHPWWARDAPGALTSAALFGAFLSVTTAAVQCASARLALRERAPAIAGLTVAFGIGQCLGPLLGGASSDVG